MSVATGQYMTVQNPANGVRKVGLKHCASADLVSFILVSCLWLAVFDRGEENIISKLRCAIFKWHHKKHWVFPFFSLFLMGIGGIWLT